MGEIKFVTGLVLAVLFTIAIVSFAVNFATDNDTTIDLSSDDDFSGFASSLSSDIESFNVQTNDSSEAFSNSEVSEGDETTRTGGQFKVGIGSVLSAVGSLLSIIQAKIFGNDVGFGIIFTLFSGLLVYIAIRYVWKTWKGGNPD